MVKTVKIGEKEVKLSNNITWCILYRDQFGQDIIPTLVPLVAGVADIISGIITETGGKDMTMEDIAGIIDGGTVIDALGHIAAAEFTDFLHITWAMAKAADASTPDPMTWLSEFDTFPLDEVVPAVGKMIVGGLVTSKNLKRLKGVTEALKPENPFPSKI